MIAMGGMEMSIMEVVDVVPMWYSHVAAIRTMHMDMFGVHDAVVD